MFYLFEIVTVMLVALTMALSLAHALELPGKLRLAKDQYIAVQAIYYPGFTIGGVGEMLGVFATLALALMTPRTSPAFWPAIVAFAAMLVTHLTYWIAIHPVNNFWVQGTKLSAAGSSFFAFDFLTRGGPANADWTALRDRWEYSHVARAIFSTIALVAMVVAVSI
jgi:hypothetical protein